MNNIPTQTEVDIAYQQWMMGLDTAHDRLVLQAVYPYMMVEKPLDFLSDIFGF